MCLRNPSKLKVAEQDIEVVKYLRPGFPEGLYSPFKGFYYALGEELAVSPESWRTTKEDPDLEHARPWAAVRYGFHSFKNKLVPDEPLPLYADLASRRHDEWHQLTKVDHCKPYRAIIPKGTEYYEGDDDWGVPAYASEKIKVIEELPT